ncbi:MAG TPA: Hsp20/alpha crystallin family protein [Candidatus Methylomirabilis sp.]|nr:Hsp20/alpha crystallin family protein [Candidatus Methylomirabilis sp.]
MLARWNRWEPLEEINKIQREIGTLFGRTFGMMEFAPTTRPSTWFPPMEAFYYQNALVLRTFVSGVEPKSVDISVTGNLLTIKGDRKLGVEIARDDYLFSEIAYGTFERTLTLPEGLKTDKVHAKYFNGVLEITVPVLEGVLPKKVAVEVVPSAEKILAGATR